jgi:threonine synthase
MTTTETRAGLACSRCDWRGELANVYACPACGDSLTVLPPPRVDVMNWTGEGEGLWRYRQLLPVSPFVAPVSLGEGGTPLILARHIGGGQLFLKNETVNPTGSFKDRPVAVATTVAIEFGLPGLICASTGNTAVSVAAYGARAGLPAICVVPHTAPSAKLAQIVATGGSVVRVRGTYSDAYALAREGAGRSGWANLTTTYVNPYMLEGDKTIAFELWEQLGGRAPDWVFVPVGAGPLLAAVAKGFAELRDLGILNGEVPKMVAVQAAGCAPIAAAFDAGRERVEQWGEAIATGASSIADPLHGYAADGTRTLAAVRASRGAAVAVPEEAIYDGMLRLARREGLFVEPGSAAVVPAYEQMVASGRVRPDETAVLLLTGHGLKDPAALARATGLEAADEAPPLEPGDTAGLAAIMARESG